MSGSLQEYVAYLDTHNAEPKVDPSHTDDNPTNDVIVPCQFPQRLNVAQVSLGSLELPLAQYNIEHEWSVLNFDEGLDLYVLNNDDSIVQFTVEEQGVLSTARLPPRLNPITSISPSGVNVTAGDPVTFTTQYPHCLSLRDFFQWGEAMKIVSTPLAEDDGASPPGSYPSALSGSRVITIVDAYTFTVSHEGPNVTFLSPTAPSTIWGYVTTPSIPSPVYLAELVTRALGEVLYAHYKVTYDGCTGQYRLCWVGQACEVGNVAPAYLVYQGSASLGHLMGWPCANVLIPMEGAATAVSVVAWDKPRDPPSLSSNCLTSSSASLCRSKVQIDVGNYNPDGLMANIARQLNRFYFDPGSNNGIVLNYSPPQFSFSDQWGVTHTVSIDFGKYSPEMLAAYLQTKMAPFIPDMAVTWDLTQGRFTFASAHDFGLEFNILPPTPLEPVISAAELAFRLGFYPLSYRNNNTYSSVIPFYYPTKGCCLETKNLSYVYTPMPQALLNNQKRFAVELSKPRTIKTVGPVVDNGDGTVTFTTQIYLTAGGIYQMIAHGFQVNDVVEVTDPSGVTHEVVVVRVDAYNQFTVDKGSSSITTINPITDPVNNYYSLRLSGTIVSNLYFSGLENDVLALTLGFGRCDALWTEEYPTSWLAPALYCLDYPNYVLVELTQPTGATHNMHPWSTDADHTDTLTNILAKVILYPQFRMERNFPFQMIIPDLRAINRVKIRILNPDHSLYRLHARNFSFTLVFHAVNKSINQLCY